MTAATLTARAPAPTRAGTLRLAAGRLLRLELRRNAMLWLMPLIVLLFWFDTYRSSTSAAALWVFREVPLETGHGIVDFAPFVAGASAWTASRDSRRGTYDQVAVTPLPRWTARLIAFAATGCWAMIGYAACVGVLFGATAAQGATGSPFWWPVAVNAAGILALGALGFLAGTLLPSRFTVPVVGLGAEVALVLGQFKITRSTTYGVVSPTSNVTLPGPDAGIFHHFLPDAWIVQLMFLGGLAVLAVGALGLVPGGARRARVVAATVALVGLAACGTGFGLAGTAQQSGHGTVISAVHDAADDRPLEPTLTCEGAVPMCVAPAYRSALTALEKACEPVLGELAGLPGAPARVAQTAFNPSSGPNGVTMTMEGGSPEILLSVGLIGWRDEAQFASLECGPIARAAVEHVVGAGTPAQQAVATGLLSAGGVRNVPSSGGPPRPGAVAGPASDPASADAAQRFAALPTAARMSWLRTHLAALRAGNISLEQLP